MGGGRSAGSLIVSPSGHDELVASGVEGVTKIRTVMDTFKRSTPIKPGPTSLTRGISVEEYITERCGQTLGNPLVIMDRLSHALCGTPPAIGESCGLQAQLGGSGSVLPASGFGSYKKVLRDVCGREVPYP